MILDTLSDLSIYDTISPGFYEAFRRLRDPEVTNAKIGKHVFIPDRLFMSVEEYAGRTRIATRWEAHRKFIDIQYVVSGSEVMGRRNVASLTPKDGYIPEKDIEFFDDDDGFGDFFTLSAGDFAIFFPHDAHMPSIAAEAGGRIRKIVFKVAVSGWQR
jgi:YhcH/YjgK/YiaL family protein